MNTAVDKPRLLGKDSASHLFCPPSKKIRGKKLSNVPDEKDGERGRAQSCCTKYTYEEAVSRCPFVDRDHYSVIIRHDCALLDGNGKVVCVVIREAYPEYVALAADRILSPAASRSSLRAGMYGGESPLSGIAGYYDYFGSPIEYKCRKTAFTDENVKEWPTVFPLVEYANRIYQQACPTHWEAQNRAIPDLVRIRGTVFSTLTINERFRTARHTDAGDFDAGLGMISVVRGEYGGLCLGFPDFKVCVDLRPRDMMLFNTHFFHCNTELEVPPSLVSSWHRLSCVFYYRANLGGPTCLENYARRLEAHKGKVHVELTPTENGTNLNKSEEVVADPLTPGTLLLGWARIHVSPESLALYALFDEFLNVNRPSWCRNTPHLAPRPSEDVQSQKELLEGSRKDVTSGFSETSFTEESPDVLANIEQFKLPDELMALWTDSRDGFLTSVASDWKRMCLRNPDRLDFTWDNKGKTNKAFFDLCDVAVGMMKAILVEDEVTKAQRTSFFGALAVHLFRACAVELNMPKTAMSLRKLNVKIKDYEFGGTRYFKDMPPEEQERRRVRQMRIEQASKLSRVKSDNWLLKDGYDYQTEDSEVSYDEKNPSPQNFFRERSLCFRAAPRTDLLNGCKSTTQVLASACNLIQSEIKKETAMQETSVPATATKARILLIRGSEPNYNFTAVGQDVYTKLEEGSEMFYPVRSEVERLLLAYQKQVEAHSSTHWESTSCTEVIEVGISDLLEMCNHQESTGSSETFHRLSSVDFIVAIRTASFLPLASLHTLFHFLVGLNKPLIFDSFVGDDPKHFLLETRTREAYEAAVHRLMPIITRVTETSSPGTWSCSRWCCWLQQHGWIVLGNYLVTGAALNDTFFSLIPQNVVGEARNVKSDESLKEDLQNQ